LQLECLLKDEKYIAFLKLHNKESLINFEYLLIRLCELNGNFDKLLAELQVTSLKPLIERLNSSLITFKEEKSSLEKRFSSCYDRILSRRYSLHPKDYKVCFSLNFLTLSGPTFIYSHNPDEIVVSGFKRVFSGDEFI